MLRGGNDVQFVFGDHTLDGDRRELRRGAEPIAVEPQVFDLLIYLVQNRDRVVSKDDLIEAVWGGRIVSDSTLTSRINAARKAIGDSGEEQKLIRTDRAQGPALCRRRAQMQPSGPRAHDSAGTTAERSGRFPRATLPLPDRPAIAVLPFINMSGEPEQEYFSDGISEDIITALSKLRWFFVIARNSSFTYKGKAVHLKQIAEELGVGYVVEGSVRKEGERVRITAQLNDVATGSHIWAERYDRDIADVFAVQDEITEAIVAAIEPQLYAAENFRAQRKAPGQHGCLGPGDARPVALLAADATGQRGRASVAREGYRHRSQLWPGARCARHQPHVQRAHGLGGHGEPRCRSPNVPRWPRSGPTARIPGRTTRWAMSIFSRGGSTIRSPNSSWRCSLIRTSRWRRRITA